MCCIAADVVWMCCIAADVVWMCCIATDVVWSVCLLDVIVSCAERIEVSFGVWACGAQRTMY